MNRLPLIAALSFVAFTSAACVADDPSAPGDEVSTTEQAVESCQAVSLSSYRGTEQLFDRTTYNPWVVLTQGDRDSTFYAWGIENGTKILWVKRVADRDYGQFIAHVNRNWTESEIPGSESTWGISGSIYKGPPIPPSPPVGFPCDTVNVVLDAANQNLATTGVMLEKLQGMYGY